MSEISLYWSSQAIEPELATMLNLFAEEYPIAPADEQINLEFIKTNNAGATSVKLVEGTWRIEYSNLTTAARGLGTALSGIEADELMTYETFGIMLDASRNGVMTVTHLKKWLRRLALMGYNMAMLYTEDTYKLPDEPYFGYMRGAYTLEEMREVDDYAHELGIEMIACIQTLGHMEQIIKWVPAFNPVADTARVLNIGEDVTYELVDKMLEFWSSAFHSRRIHIGMDETHDLGRGKFMDKYGHVDGFTLFNRHLNQVNSMCEKYALSPMIWSDMYFKLGNEKQEYYDLNSNIPQEVRENIPENVELVYWDYTHQDYQFYCDFIKLHQELNRPVALGGGVYTWSKFWYDHNKTKVALVPALQACRDCGVKNVFFTMWGDDGAFCAWDSALAGLLFAAEVAYHNSSDESNCPARFAALCDGDYEAHILAGGLDIHDTERTKLDPNITTGLCAYHLFWDDPVMGLAWNYYTVWNPEFDKVVLEDYQKIYDGLLSKRSGDGCTNLNHPFLITTAIIKKLSFRRKLLTAYQLGDREKVAELAADIPSIVLTYEQVADSFRAIWNSTFKPFGFEVLQIRNAGQIARWRELQRKLLEYSSGALESVEELEQEVPLGRTASKPHWYKGMATSSAIL